MDLPRHQQRDAFRKAFGLWSAVTPLNIREVVGVSDDKVDIHVDFARGYHKDPYPFDGQGGTLAHAYYPHNNLGNFIRQLPFQALLDYCGLGVGIA